MSKRLIAFGASVAILAGASMPVAAPACAQEVASPIAAWSRTTAAAEDQGSLLERGAAVYNNWCVACHGRDPTNAPGTTSLEHKYQGAMPAVLEDREDLTAELVEFFVRNGVATMPFFRKTEISDADLEALAAYLSRAKN
jgi:mono/diheme cytochrome c family protein